MRKKYLVVDKLTQSLSYTVSVQTLRTVKRKASEAQKKPLIVLELTGQMMYLPEKWAMIPYEDFKALTEEHAANDD